MFFTFKPPIYSSLTVLLLYYILLILTICINHFIQVYILQTLHLRSDLNFFSILVCHAYIRWSNHLRVVVHYYLLFSSTSTEKGSKASLNKWWWQPTSNNYLWINFYLLSQRFNVFSFVLASSSCVQKRPLTILHFSINCLWLLWTVSLYYHLITAMWNKN